VSGSEVRARPATKCQNQAIPDHGRFRPRPDAGRPRGRDAGRRSRTTVRVPAPAPAPTGSGLRRKARIRPMPKETGSRPIHHGNGGPVLGMCPGPAACGGTPPAGAVGAADGATAPADGPTAPGKGAPEGPTEGATAPGPGVVGAGEGLVEAPLGADVDGEGDVMPRLGPDGWWPERTTSMTTARNRSTAMIAATGRMDWAAAPPRRAMPASCLSSSRRVLGRSVAKQNYTPVVIARNYSLVHSAPVWPFGASRQLSLLKAPRRPTDMPPCSR